VRRRRRCNCRRLCLIRRVIIRETVVWFQSRTRSKPQKNLKTRSHFQFKYVVRERVFESRTIEASPIFCTIQNCFSATYILCASASCLGGRKKCAGSFVGHRNATRQLLLASPALPRLVRMSVLYRNVALLNVLKAAEYLRERTAGTQLNQICRIHTNNIEPVCAHAAPKRFAESR